jgi:hypothetical protein
MAAHRRLHRHRWLSGPLALTACALLGALGSFAGQAEELAEGAATRLNPGVAETLAPVAAAHGGGFSWSALEGGLHEAWRRSLHTLHLASDSPSAIPSTALAEPPVTSRFKQALLSWRDHYRPEPKGAARLSADTHESSAAAPVAGDATRETRRFRLADSRASEDSVTMNDGQVALLARFGARAAAGQSLVAPAPCTAESSVYCEGLKAESDHLAQTLDGGYNSLRWYQAVQLGFATRF